MFVLFSQWDMLRQFHAFKLFMTKSSELCAEIDVWLFSKPNISIRWSVFCVEILHSIVMHERDSLWVEECVSVCEFGIQKACNSIEECLILTLFNCFEIEYLNFAVLRYFFCFGWIEISVLLPSNCAYFWCKLIPGFFERTICFTALSTRKKKHWDVRHVRSSHQISIVLDDHLVSQFWGKC